MVYSAERIFVQRSDKYAKYFNLDKSSKMILFRSKIEFLSLQRPRAKRNQILRRFRFAYIRFGDRFLCPARFCRVCGWLV